ncbi:MAG: TIGR03936 family radical SAM-associated protein [Lachnospiraceae bacterium]|nr:TIGR03936 family radical SAM-associated protein [Lachnospiraceae bacterium]
MTNNNFKLRFKFEKGEEVKFISHLDIVRLYQRAARRASLPMAYSNGFNPHQLMTFANPLSLGMTSIGEYGEAEFTQYITPSEFINRINEELPTGAKILGATECKAGGKSAMAKVSAALYYAFFDDAKDFEKIKSDIEAFMAQKEIIVSKKTKNSVKDTDIRPDIFDIKALEYGGKEGLSLFLASGSVRNLKAGLVVFSLCGFSGVEFNKFKIKYKRIDVFYNDNGGYRNLLDIGTML